MIAARRAGTIGEQSPELAEFLARLATQDRDGAVVQVRELHLGGAQVPDLITGLFVPALHEVGRRWFTGAWNIVEEHVATAIVDAALTAVCLHGPTATPTTEVVVACAPDDWHALAARCVAEILRCDGWRVTQTGASLPPGQLASFLGQVRDVVLVMCCTMTTHLPGAAEMIGVAHRRGVPVIVGGPGMGSDGRRARILGADVWANDLSGATAALTRLVTERPPLAEPDMAVALLDEAQRLARLRRTIVAAVGSALPGFDDDEGYQHLDLLVRSCEAALLVGDRSIVDDYLRWVTAYDVTRSRSTARSTTMGAAVHAWLPTSFPETRRLLDAGPAPSHDAGQNLGHTDDAGGS